jgi:hypothetical protein
MNALGTILGFGPTGLLPARAREALPFMLEKISKDPIAALA